MAYRDTGVSAIPGFERSMPYPISTRLAVALMGHRPFYDDATPMEVLHEYYLYFKGDAPSLSRPGESTLAVFERIKELHPEALEYFANPLQKGNSAWQGIPADERCIVYHPEVGQRTHSLQVDSKIKGHPGYNLLAGYTAPLINRDLLVQGPGGKDHVMPAEDYTQAWAQEVRLIKSLKSQNLAGQEPSPVPERRFRALPPFVGSMKIHVAPNKQHFADVASGQFPDHWVSEMHFVNAVQRKNLTITESKGFPATAPYANVLRLGYYLASEGRGDLYSIPYSPDLEREMFKRLELFIQCVHDEVSPSSPRIARRFDHYPVQPPLSQKLKVLPPNIESIAMQALGEIDQAKQNATYWEHRHRDFFRVLDKAFADYASSDDDQFILPDGRTLKRPDQGHQMDMHAVADELGRSLRMMQSIEHLFLSLSDPNVNVTLEEVYSRLDDMLTSQAVNRDLIEQMLRHNDLFSHDQPAPPQTVFGERLDSSIHQRLSVSLRTDPDLNV